MTRAIPSWKIFCRALSTSDLPECRLPQGHLGAHSFGPLVIGDKEESAFMVRTRCQVMLAEAYGSPNNKYDPRFDSEGHSDYLDYLERNKNYIDREKQEIASELVEVESLSRDLTYWDLEE